MQRISRLLIKKISGHLSAEEDAELQAWASDSKKNQQMLDRLTDHSELKKTMDIWRMIDTHRACGEMQSAVNRTIWTQRIKRTATAAAAVAVIAGLTVLFRPDIIPQADRPTITAGPASAIENIRPGTTCATLYDSPGHKIILNACDTAKVLTGLLGHGEVPHPETEAVTVENLCLDVPRGGEFKVQLEDGTEVWLNSASKLYYPKSFSTEERKVRIEGEVYLSVATDSLRPFYVESGNQLVRVYGTEFNVRHYPEDNEVYTTLESGRISLSRTDGNGGEFFITPGHQGVFDNNDSSVSVRPVNTDVVTSWRKGRFVFEHHNLRRIMQDLSRWYDFEFEFLDSSIESEEFMGSIPRYSDFTTAISILEKCGGIHFSVNNGKVLISRSEN